MSSVDIQDLLFRVREATRQVEKSIDGGLERTELLNRFWLLQDNLTRLVQAASDEREEVLRILERQHPDLLRQTAGVLQAANTSQGLRLAAVRNSCDASNHSLLRIKLLAGRSTAAGLNRSAAAG